LAVVIPDGPAPMMQTFGSVVVSMAFVLLRVVVAVLRSAAMGEPNERPQDVTWAIP
jgi:hypothetical protein